MQHKKILLIEDDQDLNYLLDRHLSDLGAEVCSVNSGDEGLALAHNQYWDLIITDIELPGASGLNICRELRSEGRQTPVFFISSRASEVDRIIGLDMGADDYISKPFSILELIARIRSLFRRTTSLIAANEIDDSDDPNKNKLVQVCNLRIDQRTHEAFLGENRLDLTSTEFNLLLHFANHPGQVFQRTELLNSVWGYGYDGYEHTVNSHVNRLRAKIEDDPSNPKYITTVWGVGYKLEDANALCA